MITHSEPVNYKLPYICVHLNMLSKNIYNNNFFNKSLLNKHIEYGYRGYHGTITHEYMGEQFLIQTHKYGRISM